MNRKKYKILVEQISEPLTKYIAYEKGVEVRKALKVLAKKNYLPKHSKERQFNFIKNQAGSFSITECHPQETNQPFVYCLFTVASQHVYGNCLEECIDEAILSAKRRNEKC